MERTTRLAGLKLVNKYYPSASNYSYPRHDATPAQRCEASVNGRSSVGSDCSVPEMVEDQESDISIEDTNQSHMAGDETFDSFWEDSESFWGVEPGDKSSTVLGPISHPAALQQDARSMVLEEGRHRAPQRSVENARHGTGPCWPLAAAEPPVSPRPNPSKPSCYSLFPPPAPQHDLVLRRPAVQVRSEAPWNARKQFPLAVSLSLPNRRKKPRKLHLPASDSAISYDSSVLTQSAPGTPTLLVASPTAVAFSRRSQQTLPSQRNSNMSRAHSDMKIVHCVAEGFPRTPTTQLALPTAQPDGPRGLQTHNWTHSHLRQAVSAMGIPSTPRLTPTPVDSMAPPHTPPLLQPRASASASRPATPLAQQVVMPVSVFEHDSDSDSDSDSAANFARRIVKNLTPHKHSRSASAAPRSRKGGSVAREQLRRTRAGTVASGGEVTPTAADEGPEARGNQERGPAATAPLRKHKSEVFGSLFGRKR